MSNGNYYPRNKNRNLVILRNVIQALMLSIKHAYSSNSWVKLAAAFDVGPTLDQHMVIIWCLLG